jgi:hypothetical protein
MHRLILDSLLFGCGLALAVAGLIISKSVIGSLLVAVGAVIAVVVPLLIVPEDMAK